MSLRTELFRAGSVGLAIRVMAVLAGLFCSVVLARFMGPHEYGLYAYVFAIVSLLALPAQTGLPALIVRETARGAAEQDWPVVRGIWTWAVWLVLVASVLTIAAVVLGIDFIGAAEGGSPEVVLLWALPIIPLLALNNIGGSALLGLKRVFLGKFPDQVFRPTLFAVLFGSAVILNPGFATASSGLILLGAVLLLTLGLTVAFMFKASPDGLRSCREIRFERSKWYRAIIPLSLITGMQLVSQYADLLMLGLFRSPEEVGLYRIALSVSSLAILGLTAFNMVVQPYIAELHLERDSRKLQLIVSMGATAAIVVTVPVVSIFYFSGSDLIALFYGVAYADAYPALVILSIGAVFTAYFGVSGVLLTMANFEKVIVRTLAISTFSNVVLNALFIPKYGTSGAAIATGISVAVLNILLWYVAKKNMTIDCTPRTAVSLFIDRVVGTGRGFQR